MKSKFLLLLILQIGCYTYSQNNLDFITNSSLKKEVTFMLNFLEESKISNRTKDSITFIHMNYIGRGINDLDVYFSTTLFYGCWYIKNEKLYDDHCKIDNDNYVDVGNNIILLLRDMEDFIDVSKIEKTKIDCNKVMKKELFCDSDVSTDWLNNEFEYIFENNQFRLRGLKVFRLDLFLKLKYDIDVLSNDTD